MLSFCESPEDKSLNECIKRSNEFAGASQWGADSLRFAPLTFLLRHVGL